MRSLISAPLLAFGVAVLVTPLVMRLGWRLGAVDRPGPRKVHARPVPRLGGLAIALGFLVTVAGLWLFSSSVSFLMVGRAEQLLVVLAGGLVMLAIGLVDDCRGVATSHKLLAAVGVAVGVYLLGVRADTFPVPGLGMVHLGWLAAPVTVLWLVGITNAVNICDGLDGQAAGVGLIASVVIAVFAVFEGEHLAAAMMLALAGALGGFWVYNRHPAKTFMGDSGSLFVGFILAGMSLVGSAKASTTVGLMVPILVLGVPIFDTLIAMCRRFLQRRSVFSADRGHVHHELIRMGCTHRRAVQVIYGTSLVGAAMALLIMFSRGQRAGVIFVVGLTLILLLFRLTGMLNVRQSLSLLRGRFAEVLESRNGLANVDDWIVAIHESEDLSNSWDRLCAAAALRRVTRMTLYVAGEALPWRQWESPQPPTRDGDPMHAVLPLGPASAGLGLLEVEMETRAGGAWQAWRDCAPLARLAGEVPEAHLIAAAGRLREFTRLPVLKRAG